MANQSRKHTRLVDILRASTDSDALRYEFSEDGTELTLHNIEVKVKFQTDSDTPFIVEEKNFTHTGQISQIPTHGKYATQTVSAGGISWTGVDSEGYIFIHHMTQAGSEDSDTIRYWDGSTYYTLRTLTYNAATEVGNGSGKSTWNFSFDGTWVEGTPPNSTGVAVLIRDSENVEPIGYFKSDSRKIFIGADSDSDIRSNVVNGGVDIVFGEKSTSFIAIGRSNAQGQIMGWRNDGTNPVVRFESITIDSEDGTSWSRNLRNNITINGTFSQNANGAYVFAGDSDETFNHTAGTLSITGDLTTQNSESVFTFTDSDNTFTFDAKNLDWGQDESVLKIINAAGTTQQTYVFALDRT